MGAVEDYINRSLSAAIAKAEAAYACPEHGFYTIIAKPGMEHVEPMVGWCVICGTTTPAPKERPTKDIEAA